MELFQNIIIIIFLFFAFVLNVQAKEVYSWSKSEINIFQSATLNSQVIGKIGVGGKVEILDFEGEETIVNEYLTLNSIDGKDTIQLSGKLIKIKDEELEGFCLDTYLSRIEYDALLLQNDSVYFPFEYYKRILDLKEIKRESSVTDEGDGKFEVGEILYSDNSIMKYEYSGYGGGCSIQIDEMNWKDFFLLSVKLLEIHSRKSDNIQMMKEGVIIGLDNCESIFFQKLQSSKMKFRYSAGC